MLQIFSKFLSTIPHEEKSATVNYFPNKQANFSKLRKIYVIHQSKVFN